MPEIVKDFTEINKQIADLRNTSADAAQEVTRLKKELHFDPTNITKIREKYAQLGTQIKENVKLQAAYAEKEQQIRNEMSKTDPSTKKYKELQRELERTESAAEKVETRLRSLNAEIGNNAERNEVLKAKLETVNKQYEAAEKATQKLSRTVMVLVGAMTLLVKKTMEQGNELYSLSVRYNTSAESLQRYNRQLQLATGQTDLYTSAMSVMTKGMAQIAAGRGVAYSTALRNIGLSAQMLAGKDSATQYQMIFDALTKVANATDRAAAAQQLFGDAGMYIAQVAGLETEKLAELNAETDRFGYLTDEQTQKLYEANLMWEQTKSQLDVVKADLAVALQPAMEELVEILNDYAIPAIKDLSDWFSKLGKGGQITVLFLLGLLIILPKIIGMIKAWQIANALMGLTIRENLTPSIVGLNVATANWQIILLAVAAVVLLIISLFRKSANEAKSAQSEYDKLIEKANAFNGMNSELSSVTESTTSTMTERNVNVSVDIYGHGDTAISDDAASKLAYLTMDEIQKNLGGLI